MTTATPSPLRFISHASFIVSLLIGAALLFWVQPMISRAMLPSLGGAPAVWITSLLWFQTTLLAGYALSHILACLHPFILKCALLLLTGLSLSLLPLDPTMSSITTHDYHHPVWWLLKQLTLKLGPLFLLLSCTSSTVQLAYARLHNYSKSPYWLYALSNVGSLSGLLLSVLWIAPTLGMKDQFSLWCTIFTLYAAAMSLVLILMPLQKPEAETQAAPSSAPPTSKNYGWWMLLGFAPTCLMLAMTHYVTADVTPVPLFWTVPLTLFIISYIWAFAERTRFPTETFLKWQPMLVLPMLLYFSAPAVQASNFILVIWQVFMFFISALLLQRRLYEARPPAQHLTQFYLCMSFGGALAGVFCAILAPMLFANYAEYILALILTLWLRPTDPEHRTSWKQDLKAPILIILLGLPFFITLTAYLERNTITALWVALCILGVKLCFEFTHRPRAMALTFAAILLVHHVSERTSSHILLHERNFYGSLKVIKKADNTHMLQHGTTSHGIQSREEGQMLTPLSYYHTDGPMGDIATIATTQHASLNILITGLGVGSTSCLFRDSDAITYFEINPLVQQIAENKTLFSFLSDCPPSHHVIIGDGRLLLKKEPDAQYDLIILDAFNSDAVPVHLITQEAITEHMSKLKPDGMLVLHISNRYLMLDRMLMQTVTQMPVRLYIRSDLQPEPESKRYASQWAVISHKPVAALQDDTNWLSLSPYGEEKHIWTDNHTPILPYLKLW